MVTTIGNIGLGAVGMEPMTMGAIGMGAGGMLSAMGGMKAGNAQSQISEYNAQISERNQKTAKIRADHDLLLAKSDAIQCGVSAGGSTVTVAMESARRADLELTNEAYNAKRKYADGLEQAKQFGFQAGITRAEGAARASSLRNQAFSSLLSTAGSIGMKYA